MYVYESHLGGGYFGSETPLSFAECYCDQCGDSDWEVGEFETAEQFVAYIADDICFEPGRGGWAVDVVTEDVNRLFASNLTEDDVIRIAKANATQEEDYE